MKYTPVGVDIAKHLIQVHLINEHTGEVVDKQLRRPDFLTFFSNREPCLIGMEACGGSQHWARELKKLGHEVRLMQARFVKAFVMGNKNDMMDARAIWMAVQQPGKEIAVKTEEQQSVLVLHRSRRQLVKFRTAQINALHGTLLDHFAQSFQTVRLIKTGEGRNCQPGLLARNIEFDSLIFAKTCSNLSVTTIKLMTQRFYCFLRVCRVPQRTINLNPVCLPVVISLGDLPTGYCR